MKNLLIPLLLSATLVIGADNDVELYQKNASNVNEIKIIAAIPGYAIGFDAAGDLTTILVPDLANLTPGQVTQITQAIDFSQLTPTQVTALTQAIDFSQLTPAQETALASAIADDLISSDVGNTLALGTDSLLFVPGSVNLYNTDGTLTGDRLVSQNGNKLSFQGINAVGDDFFVFDMQEIRLWNRGNDGFVIDDDGVALTLGANDFFQINGDPGTNGQVFMSTGPATPPIWGTIPPAPTPANAISPRSNDATGSIGTTTTEFALEDHKHPAQLPSLDPNNMLAVGPDGLHRLTGTDAISTDPDNLVEEGSDGKIYVPGNMTQTGTPLSGTSTKDYVVQWDGTKFVNVLAFERETNANGQFECNHLTGVLRQWGTVSGLTGDDVITLPTTFAAGGYNVYATSRDPNPGNNVGHSVTMSPISVTTFRLVRKFDNNTVQNLTNQPAS